MKRCSPAITISECRPVEVEGLAICATAEQRSPCSSTLSSLMARAPDVPLKGFPDPPVLRALAAQYFARLGMTANVSPNQNNTDSSEGLVGEEDGTSTTDICPRIMPFDPLELKGSVDLRVPGVIGANFELVICGGPEVRDFVAAST